MASIDAFNPRGPLGAASAADTAAPEAPLGPTCPLYPADSLAPLPPAEFPQRAPDAVPRRPTHSLGAAHSQSPVRSRSGPAARSQRSPPLELQGSSRVDQEQSLRRQSPYGKRTYSVTAVYNALEPFTRAEAMAGARGEEGAGTSDVLDPTLPVPIAWAASGRGPGGAAPAMPPGPEAVPAVEPPQHLRVPQAPLASERLPLSTARSMLREIIQVARQQEETVRRMEQELGRDTGRGAAQEERPSKYHQRRPRVDGSSALSGGRPDVSLGASGVGASGVGASGLNLLELGPARLRSSNLRATISGSQGQRGQVAGPPPCDPYSQYNQYDPRGARGAHAPHGSQVRLPAGSPESAQLYQGLAVPEAENQIFDVPGAPGAETGVAPLEREAYSLGGRDLRLSRRARASSAGGQWAPAQPERGLFHDHGAGGESADGFGGRFAAPPVEPFGDPLRESSEPASRPWQSKALLSGLTGFQPEGRQREVPGAPGNRAKPVPSQRLSVALLEYKYRVSALGQQMDSKIVVYPKGAVPRHIAAQFLPKISSLRSKLRSLEKRAAQQGGDSGAPQREIASLLEALNRREASLAGA